MRISIKIAFIFAAVWIAFKLLGYQIGWNIPENTKIFVMSNMFCLISAISLGLYFQKRSDQEASSIMTDIKNGMVPGVIYSLTICIFLYVYYEKIDPGYNEVIIAQREAYFEKIINNPVKFKELKEANDNLSVMSKEEILENFKKTPQILFSGSFMMTFGILSMLMLSTFYSILITVIYRKLLFR